MSYIDGFVIPVKTARRADYVKLSASYAEVFTDAGATRVVECWGDDVPQGATTSFPLAVKLEADETVAFGWIEWPSKEVRDAGNLKVRNDPRMAMSSDMPMNPQRMIFGGFIPLR
jgi:uncharacterized protein YbaA (DUF1428 family)